MEMDFFTMHELIQAIEGLTNQVQKLQTKIEELIKIEKEKK